jgi:hypothetical protein
MKRRTLDFLFSAGGLALSLLLVILGLVMTSNADFARDYVKDQLGQQRITFTPVAGLDEAERESSCVVANAGKPLTTGKQAECYANDYIGLHLEGIAAGKTYAELGEPQTALREEVAAAEKSGDPDLATLKADLAKVTGQRETLFKGETLRGLLLTSFGFSVFGVKGGEVATVSFIVAGLLALLSLAGLAHALRTSRDVG